MIEGVPEGWRLVRIGKIENEEFFIDRNGDVVQYDIGRGARFNKNYVIIRKIEKPKKPEQYRPFENAAEFRPHKNRWMTHPENTVIGEFQVVEFNDNGIWCNGMKKLMPYKTAFEIGLRFDDGTPFGIEVTE